MNDTTNSSEIEAPAYHGIQEMMSAQAATLEESLSGEAQSEPDPDPGGKILESISANRTLADDSEHVSALAALGYSIETTAEALDLSVEEVEEIAEERLRELMRMQVSSDELPSEQELWSIYYIIYREEYATMFNILGVKDVAEQIEWDSLVEWIEENIEQPGGQYDYKTWFAAVEEAVRNEEE